MGLDDAMYPLSRNSQHLRNLGDGHEIFTHLSNATEGH